MSSLLAFVVACSLLCASIAASPMCLDKDGNPVDWFIVYKLPKIDDASEETIQNGAGFIYSDANSEEFHLSKSSIQDDQGAVADTFNQVYKMKDKRNDDAAYVFYNDEDPSGGEHFDNGHTKGAIAFDSTSGFWMIDSVPGFPPYIDDGFSYPHHGLMYGQMFMCISYNSSTFDDIGYQLRTNNVHVHDSNLPRDLAQDFPNVEKVIQGDMVNKSPYYSVKHFSSLGGVSFYDFAKSTDFGDDLYAGLVAPTLKVDLLAATWQRGTKRLGPSCDKYTVENIKQMNIKVEDTFQFSNEDDHSKYAIAKTSHNPIVCIGDINRMGTQFSRGGGTSCFKNSAIWKQMRAMVADIESC